VIVHKCKGLGQGELRQGGWGKCQEIGRNQKVHEKKGNNGNTNVRKKEMVLRNLTTGPEKSGRPGIKHHPASCRLFQFWPRKLDSQSSVNVDAS
jgi:hypothetical protein